MIEFHKQHFYNCVKPEHFTAVGNKEFSFSKFNLVKSCTQALELSVLALNLPAQSEIILPSFALSSLANAIHNFGYQPVFVDCELETMNINPEVIEKAITPLTKAVITINYSGVSCDYDILIPLCRKYGLYLIEDNAHGIMASYKGKPLGSFGDFSTFSFDHLKMISCYEGGAVVVNNQELSEKFAIVSELGTNRKDFINRKADFYEWKFKGTNAKLAEPLQKILEVQLSYAIQTKSVFIDKWNRYHSGLKLVEERGDLKRMFIPDYCEHNGYMYWLKTRTANERNKLMDYLLQNGIQSAFHYTPLHSSDYGRKVGRFNGEDKNTTIASSCLLRLPLYQELSYNDQDYIIQKIYDFY